MENQVPLCGTNVRVKVLIEARTWTTIVTTNLQSFAHFEIVGEAFFVFIRHVFDYFRLPFYSSITVFFVLGNARMGPIAFLSGLMVLFTTGGDGAYGLANVCCFVRARALEFINPWFSMGVVMGPVRRTQNV